MKLKLNSSLNFHHYSSGRGIVGHISRDPQYIDNTNVDPKLSKYNAYYNLGDSRSHGNSVGSYKGLKSDIYDLDKQQWGGMLRHNNHQATKNHQPRRVKTLKQFMDTKTRHKRINYVVASLGKGSRNAINKAVRSYNPDVSDSTILNTYTKALEKYAYGYNQKYKYTRMLAYGTNVDETKTYGDSSPHVHMIVYILGHTKSGNPSASVNNAMAEELHVPMKKGREAFTKCRNFEAKRLLKDTQDTFNQTFHGLDLDLDFAPSHSKVTGLNMRQYKHYQKVQDSIKSIQSRRNSLRSNFENKYSSLDSVYKSKSTQNSSLASKNRLLNKNRSGVESLMKTRHYQLSEVDNKYLSASHACSFATSESIKDYYSLMSSYCSHAPVVFSSVCSGLVSSFSTSLFNVISSNSSVSESNTKVASSNSVAERSINKTIQGNNANISNFEIRRKRIKKEQDERAKKQDERKRKQDQRDKNFKAEYKKTIRIIKTNINSMISNGMEKIKSFASSAPQKISSAVSDVDIKLHRSSNIFHHGNRFSQASSSSPTGLNALKQYNQKQDAKNQSQIAKRQKYSRDNGFQR